MLNINYVEVPATKEEDINKGLTKWSDGKYVSIDEGTHVTLYVDHREECIADGDGEERTVVRAFPIRVKKPVSRDMAINAAEMEVYGLNSAMEVASFNASLARKARANAADEEVIEHDEFIAWVKVRLDDIRLH